MVTQWGVTIIAEAEVIPGEPPAEAAEPTEATEAETPEE